MVQSPYESLLENHHMDSGQLVRTNHRPSLLYFEDANNQKRGRERMPLEGNQVITACRANTLLNQCPLISGDFLGVKHQETKNWTYKLKIH